MKNTGTFDLTQGGILNKLALVALPIIGTQLMQMSYNLVDMFLLGKLGSGAVAASGTAGMYMWFSAGFMLIGRMGAEIGVAQNLGRGDRRGAIAYSQHSLALSVFLGLILACAYLAFCPSLIGFFGIKEAEVAADAREYLYVIAFGLTPIFVSAAIAGAFNGSGNSRTVFGINATGLICNMLLDPIFIFVLGLGVRGAAIATVIAQMLVCALSVRALLTNPNRPFKRYPVIRRLDFAKIGRILRWTVPIAAESILFTYLTMYISRFVAQFGAPAIAVYRVGTQIESLGWLITLGFSTAITAFVGQNFGADRWDRIRAGYQASLRLLAMWSLFVATLFLCAGGFLFRFFLSEPELLETGSTFLKILALCQIPGGLEAVASGTFRGLGKTLPPSLAGTASNTLRVPLAWYLSTQLGLSGIWWGISLGATLRGLSIFLWLRRERRNWP